MTSKTVFCRKYQQPLEALTKPPFPGTLGQDIFENISARAWKDWQSLQTMLINEHQLSMMDPKARRYLAEQMKKFFNNEECERPAGYVPPAK